MPHRSQTDLPNDRMPVPLGGTLRPVTGRPFDAEEVFSQHVEAIYAFLFRRVGNREDAEDLTSEIFLKASLRLDYHRTEASIAAWLFTVARTVLADHWRTYYRTGALLPLEDVHAEPAFPTESHQSDQIVQDVLAALPERDRQVLELRFLRGHSIQQTAQELNLSAGNVKVLQHRALARAHALASGATRRQMGNRHRNQTDEPHP